MSRKRKKTAKKKLVKVPEYVRLDAPAFLNMITAAAEVYKRECFGFLLGDRHRNWIHVQSAITIQTAERSFRHVEISHERFRIIDTIIKDIPFRENVGEFHSHPAWGQIKGSTKLSKWDMIDCDDRSVQIVVAVNDRNRSYQWKQHTDGSISGVIGNVHIRMAAYFVMENEKGKRKSYHVPFECEWLDLIE